jgi:hypothetical protein
MLLCLRGKGFVSPEDDYVSQVLRIPLEAWLDTKDKLIKANIITADNYLINFNERQSPRKKKRRLSSYKLFDWVDEEAETTPKAEVIEVEKEKPKKPKKPIEVCPYEEIVQLFNDIMPDQISKVRNITEGVQKQIVCRWTEDKNRRSLQWWSDYFTDMTTRPFLMGLTNSNWKLTLLWAVGPRNMEKVLNDYYQKANNSPYQRKTLENAQAATDWVKKMRGKND